MEWNARSTGAQCDHRTSNPWQGIQPLRYRPVGRNRVPLDIDRESVSLTRFAKSVDRPCLGLAANLQSYL